MARHCRLCYGVGHNRRTCPSATPTQKSAYQSTSNVRRSGSRCSYCLRFRREIDRTHNVRNCPKRREDAVVWTKENAPFAENLAEELPKYGIGVGAIIAHAYNKDHFYVVTQVNWDNISKDSIANAFSAVAMDEIDPDNTWSWRGFELPNISGLRETAWSDTVVVNPLSEEEIRKQMPDDFKFGYYGMPDKLRDKKRKRRRR